MHDRVKQFVARVLQPEEIKGKFIIETGALDVNGSVRESIESAEPYHYLATDMREGPGVDVSLHGRESSFHVWIQLC